MKNDFDISDLLLDVEKDSKTIDDSLPKEDTYTSSNFAEIRDFKNKLLNTLPSSKFKLLDIEEQNKSNINWSNLGKDQVIWEAWKNVENISARLIECEDNIVLLECLVDKDNLVYEEREFDVSLFENYDLTIGNLFYLRFFKRPNEVKLQIHNDPKLTFSGDFPITNFSNKYKDSKLFK